MFKSGWRSHSVKKTVTDSTVLASARDLPQTVPFVTPVKPVLLQCHFHLTKMVTLIQINFIIKVRLSCSISLELRIASTYVSKAGMLNNCYQTENASYCKPTIPEIGHKLWLAPRMQRYIIWLNDSVRMPGSLKNGQGCSTDLQGQK